MQVTINAHQTSVNSLTATGDVQLGDNDDDTVTIKGSLKIRNENDDIVFSIDPYTGDTFTDGSLTVTGESTFAGSVTLGDSPDDIINVYGAAAAAAAAAATPTAQTPRGGSAQTSPTRRADSAFRVGQGRRCCTAT